MAHGSGPGEKRVRATLTEGQLRALVRGEVVELDGVDICLEDIGFSRMKAAVQDADLRRMYLGYVGEHGPSEGGWAEDRIRELGA